MIDRKTKAIELLSDEKVLGITLRTFNGNYYSVYNISIYDIDNFTRRL